MKKTKLDCQLTAIAGSEYNEKSVEMFQKVDDSKHNKDSSSPDFDVMEISSATTESVICKGAKYNEVQLMFLLLSRRWSLCQKTKCYKHH